MSTFKKIQIITSIDNNDIKMHLKRAIPTLGIPGVFYLKIGEKCYPDSEWIDFSIIVITWWLNDIETLINKGIVESIFMDDSYSLDLKIYNRNLLKLSIILGDEEDIFFLKDEIISFESYVKTLMNVANKFEKQVLSIDANAENTCNDFKELLKAKNKANIIWKKYINK